MNNFTTDKSKADKLNFIQVEHVFRFLTWISRNQFFQAYFTVKFLTQLLATYSLYNMNPLGMWRLYVIALSIGCRELGFGLSCERMLCWHRRFADCIFFKENKNVIFEAIKNSSLTGPMIAPRTIDKNKVIINIRRHQF